MISLAIADYVVIVGFVAVVLLIGFLSGRGSDKSTESFVVSNRNLGIFLFVLTNVATWYGGILGVGEFSYSYGLLSWFTQGLPYYLFAAIFALFFAGRVRRASLLTIPDKIEKEYGRTPALLITVLIFVLVSPAPYLLMLGSILDMLFGIGIFWSLIFATIISVSYLFRGGYKADIYTDVFEFFMMFIGFMLIIVVAYFTFGGIDYLSTNLPETHLEFTGGASPLYILVWFLIAMWTFADPGFHQRCYAAKTEKVAKYGILVSILFWMLFDFLTTTTGLYARASNPELDNAVLAFPDLANRILAPGLKGVFIAALFATILSTLNSFLFLSGVTFGNDFVAKIKGKTDEKVINKYIKYGLFMASIISIILAYQFNSVVEMWYLFGSICIPGLIIPVISSYYPKWKVSSTIVKYEIIFAVFGGVIWYLLRENSLLTSSLNEIEPMIIGLVISISIHFYGNIKG